MALSIYDQLMELHHKHQAKLPEEYRVAAAYIFGKFDVGVNAALTLLSQFHELARDPAIELAYKKELVEALLLGNFRRGKVILGTIERHFSEPPQKLESDLDSEQSSSSPSKPDSGILKLAGTLDGDEPSGNSMTCAHCKGKLSGALIHLNCCTFHVFCLQRQLQMQLASHQPLACPFDNNPISDEELRRLPRETYEELRKAGYSSGLADGVEEREPPAQPPVARNEPLLLCLFCGRSMEGDTTPDLQCHRMHSGCLEFNLMKQFKRKEKFCCPIGGCEVPSGVYTRLLPPKVVNIYHQQSSPAEDPRVCSLCSFIFKAEQYWSQPCPACGYANFH